jgi:AGCS family alanine or glycine:cation symporter
MLFTIKHLLSVYVVIPLVILLGIYFTIKFKAAQIRLLPRALKLVFTKNKDSKSALSSFAALAAVLGGNLGTGNIAGVAVGLSHGGPGSLFWMWLMAMLGASIKFVGCYLGVINRQRENGAWVGGPMYYLQNALNKPILAKIYCVLTIFGALSVGNLVQINSISMPLVTSGVSPLIIGIIAAILVGTVLLGGVQIFSKVAGRLVPVMALLYISGCAYILLTHVDQLWPCIKIIVNDAFHGEAIVGGVVGYTVIDALRVGFDRGLFATDAGIGLESILHAQVDTGEELHQAAYKQASITILAPVVVMGICMLTGMVLMLARPYFIDGLESTNLCIHAFQKGLGSDFAGLLMVTVTLCLFAFTTTLTWAYCAQTCVKFLSKSNIARYGFILLYIALIPLGSVLSTRAVWVLADLALNCMLIINLIGVFGLRNNVKRQLN